MMHIVPLLVLMLLPFSAWADGFANAQIELISNDNISYGNHLKDRVGDTSIAFKALIGDGEPLGDGIFSTVYSLEYNAYKNYTAFNHGFIGVDVTFKDKFGVGNVPWYIIGAELGYKYSNEALRDASFMSFNVEVGKHFTDDLTLSVGYSYEIENAANQVFDTKRKIMNVSGDFLWTEDLLIFGGYTLTRGDVAANMFPNGHIKADVNNVYVTDPVFGPGRSSYRLPDETLQETMVGVNYYVNENAALEASYSQIKGAVKKTIWSSYYENKISISYIASY